LFVSLRFEVLDEQVATILGMPFLEIANPHINWKRKTIKIKYRGKLMEIPTLNEPVVLTNQQQNSNGVSNISKNSFAELADESASAGDELDQPATPLT
jgi:hypothetical protein